MKKYREANPSSSGQWLQLCLDFKVHEKNQILIFYREPY
jgi:hypothetical protein